MQSWPGPRRSAEAESLRRGRAEFADACAALAIHGLPDDAELISALGGPPARWMLTGEARGGEYWFRVWALRGLLWVWADSATPAVLAGLDDEHWRVREMAAKVVARHVVDDALEQVTALRADPVDRVRTVARRAVIALTSAAPS